MAVNIEKIADLTGTSPSTVSRAIRGSGRISEKTRERILAVAREHNYQPDLVARSMVSGSTQLIGVVLPMSASGPFSRIIGGVEHAACRAGYSVVFCQTDDEERILHEQLRLLACRRVDGVLVSPHGDPSFSLSCLDQLGPAGSRAPVILVQEPFEQAEYTSVTVDNFNGARELSEHLIGHGHRDIGYIGLPPTRTADRRFDGYRAAMEEAGEDPNRVQRVHIGLSPGPLTEDPTGYVDPEWLRETLAAHPQWTALAIEHDMLAIKMIQALRTVGMRVPEDIAVVGFDDVLVAAFIDPPLTTTRQPSAEVGEVACEMLIDRIEGKNDGEDIASKRIACTMQVRRSCGCETGADGS